MEDSYVLQLLKPKFKDFHLCFCGFAECKPLHSYGPAARPNYILHYVMKGKGIYQVGETKYQLKEGQAFLIEPESLTFYQADKTDPWSYLWVGFGGTEAQRFVRDLGLNSRQLTCECEYGEELKEIVFEMLHHTSSTAENLYYLQGKLYQFFSVLARGIEIQQYSNDTKESIHVQEAIAYIKNYYSQKITVEDIANYLALNRSYLYTIFISTRKCCFYSVFRYLSSDLLHFYSNFKPIFSVQLLLLFSFLLKRACINRLSLPMWNDLRVSALPVGLLHFHNTL